MSVLEYAFSFSPDAGDGWSFCQLESCKATLHGSPGNWTVVDVHVMASRPRRYGKGDEFKFLTLGKDDPLRREIVDWLGREREKDIADAWFDELHDDTVASGDQNDEHRTVPAF